MGRRGREAQVRILLLAGREVRVIHGGKEWCNGAHGAGAGAV